jgi:hypothetical protein
MYNPIAKPVARLASVGHEQSGEKTTPVLPFGLTVNPAKERIMRVFI